MNIATRGDEALLSTRCLLFIPTTATEAWACPVYRHSSCLLRQNHRNNHSPAISKNTCTCIPFSCLHLSKQQPCSQRYEGSQQVPSLDSIAHRVQGADPFSATTPFPTNTLRHKQLFFFFQMNCVCTCSPPYSWSCRKPALLHKLAICSRSKGVTSLVTKPLRNINLDSPFLQHRVRIPHSTASPTPTVEQK